MRKKCMDFKSALEQIFTPKKKYSNKYSRILEKLGEEKRANRVKECADFLEVTVFSDGSERLTHANFCGDPLCPQCSKRKSLKLYSQVSTVVDRLMSDYKFIFVTLSVANCDGEHLKLTCDQLQTAFSRFMERPRIKKAIKGGFRALEITHDNNEFITSDMIYGNAQKHLKSREKYYRKRGLKVGDRNPNFDMYHPHLHNIFAVDKSYFDVNNPDYISQRELAEIWKECLQVDYTPIVDIRACKEKFQTSKDHFVFKKLSSAVAEVAKYAVKGSDYLCGTDEQNEETVKTLLKTIRNRKMFAFYGVFRKVRAELKQEDINEDSDLLHVSEDEETTNARPLVKVRFVWSRKENSYIHISAELVEDVPKNLDQRSA